MDKPFGRVCVVGAGFMGAQIALLCAQHGYPVRLVDTRDESLQRAAASQRQELDGRVDRREISRTEADAILSRIQPTMDLGEAAGDADLVIEAVPERLEAKRAVFAELDRVCAPHTVLATNSSSLRISAIEDATHRPDRVLNMHFYAPVWQRPMVELMRGTATSDETIQRASSFVVTIGLIPLLVRTESTGFIFNRVWRAIKKECLRVVDDGVAGHEDVDRAWMISYGSAMGPFGQMDLVGLDVVRDIEMVYYRESGDPSDLPPRLLMDKIARGELGVKTGRGFYTYPHPAYEDPDWLRGGKDGACAAGPRAKA